MKKSLLLLTILFLGFCVYSQQTHSYYVESIKVDSNNVPINYRQFYFPTKLFPEVEMLWKKHGKSSYTVEPKIIETKTDSFHLIWYSRFLFAMNEPILFNHPFSKSIYRFTWLRTFDNPLAIRIEKENDKILLYIKVTSGEGGYDPDTIKINEIKTIPDSKWNRFIKLIDSADFWNMKRSGSFGTDGSEWILEGVMPNKYHVVSVWSPGKGSKIFEIGNFLLELADLKIKEEDKY